MKTRHSSFLIWLILLLSIYSILPLIAISKYNHPQSDDYFTVIRNRKGSFTETQLAYYKKWSGRYAKNTLSYLNPWQNNNLKTYRFLPIGILALIIGAIFLLVNQLYGRVLSTSYVLAISGFFAMLYIIKMPTICQGLYWFPGYITYQVPTILSLLFLVILQQISNNKSWRLNFILKGLALFALLFITGSNIISLFIIDAVIILLNAYVIIYRKKVSLFYVVLLIFALAGSLVLLLAPGNYHRLSLFPYARNFTLSFVAALGQTIMAFVKWGLTVLTFSLLYLVLWKKVLVKKLPKNAVYSNIKFIHSAAAYLILLFLMYFLYAWITGSKPVGRAENVFYAYFIAGWFFNLHILLSKINRESFYIAIVPEMLIIALFILTIFSGNNTISTAYVDLISGKAKKYDEEIMKRYAHIKACQSDTCIVPALENIPGTLFFRDIASDYKSENAYENKSYAKFFGKKYILTDNDPAVIKSNRELMEDFLRKKREEISD